MFELLDIPAKVAPDLDALIAATIEYEQDALKSLASAQDSKEVELFRVAFLGMHKELF